MKCHTCLTDISLWASWSRGKSRIGYICTCRPNVPEKSVEIVIPRLCGRCGKDYEPKGLKCRDLQIYRVSKTCGRECANYIAKHSLTLKSKGV